VRSAFHAARAVTGIEKGVLRGLAYEPYWATRHGVVPTARFGDNPVFEEGDPITSVSDAV
jgi:hypothetical protein